MSVNKRVMVPLGRGGNGRSEAIAARDARPDALAPAAPDNRLFLDLLRTLNSSEQRKYRSIALWCWEQGRRRTAPQCSLARDHQEVQQAPSLLPTRRHHAQQPLGKPTAGGAVRPEAAVAPQHRR